MSYIEFLSANKSAPCIVIYNCEFVEKYFSIRVSGINRLVS